MTTIIFVIASVTLYIVIHIYKAIKEIDDRISAIWDDYIDTEVEYLLDTDWDTDT